MLSVVLPVYNEHGNLEPLHKEISDVIPRVSEDYEIVYVDDGSTDGSREVLKQLAEQDEHAKSVFFRKNFGQSAALQAGFDCSEGDVVVAMDADGQNDPADIPRLLDELEDGLDCVSGWRKERNDPIRKRLASRFASLLRRPFLGKTVHDYGCTLKAYRREAVNELDLQGEMHRYIPPLLEWRGYDVGEMTVNHRERTHGATKYGASRLVKGFLDMLNVWFWQKFSQRPLHIFGGAGILLGLFGVISGTYTLYLKFTTGTSLSDHFLATVAFFSFVIGLQFFISGLLADVVLKNYHASKGKHVYNIERITGENTAIPKTVR